MPITSVAPALRTKRPIRWAFVALYPLWLAGIWMDRVRKRRELAGLDEFQLDDAGIDPDYVRREVRKPFWRA
ncbi:translation initiation factor IF-2 [Microbaculum marinum]|uniref:Translation initiation factor IF-2 n=1 Tax=Microbaculum marinum TaxID=1764581 RepID=A0AAW9RUT8_9HYPH